MHMKRYLLALAILVGMIVWSCGSTDKKSRQARIINLPESLHHMELIPLSKIAASIEYIPLETSDESLVGMLPIALQPISYGNGLIYIKDNTGLMR